MQDVMKELFEFLVVLIFCETGAILLNPIPQWAHENQKEEQNDSIKFFIETLGLSKEKK